MIRSLPQYCLEEMQKLERLQKALAHKKTKVAVIIEGMNDDEKNEYNNLKGQGWQE